MENKTSLDGSPSRNRIASNVRRSVNSYKEFNKLFIMGPLNPNISSMNEKNNYVVLLEPQPGIDAEDFNNMAGSNETKDLSLIRKNIEKSPRASSKKVAGIKHFEKFIEEKDKKIAQTDEKNPQENSKKDVKRMNSSRLYVIAPLCILVLVGIILVLSFHNYDSQNLKMNLLGSWKNNTQNLLSFNIDINSCILYISDQDHTDGSTNNAKIYYPEPWFIFQKVMINYTQNDNLVNISINNPFPMDYCNISLFINSIESPIQNMSIYCKLCNIIQDSEDPLRIKNYTNITGNSLSLLFANLETGGLNINVDQGYAQLFLINITNSNKLNKIKFKNEGDIILQSTRQIYLNKFISPRQTFCFSGPKVNITTQNCTISGQTDTESYNSNKGCKGFGVLGNNLDLNDHMKQKFELETNIGNIYVNIISLNQTNNFQANTIYKSMKYDNGISLDQFSADKFESFMKSVNESSKNSPTLILNLGQNPTIPSSTTTKWVIASNQAYQSIRPWIIATMSGSLLESFTTTINGNLLPGFCPWSPVLTLQNLEQISNLLKISQGSTQFVPILISSHELQADNHGLEEIEENEISEQIISTNQGEDAEPLNNQGNKIHPNRVLTSLSDANYQDEAGIVFPQNSWEPWSDSWYFIQQEQNGKVRLQSISISGNITIIIAILLSITIAILLSILAMCLLLYGANQLCYVLCNKGTIQETYAKFKSLFNNNSNEVENEKQKITKIKFKNDNKLKNIEKPPIGINLIENIQYLISNLKNVSAILDFSVVYLARMQKKSINSFFDFMFVKKEKTQSIPYKVIVQEEEAITYKKLKDYYQQYCFLTHLEEKIFNLEVIKPILKCKGYEIERIENSSSLVYNSLIIKHVSSKISFTKEDQELDSLAQFIKYNVILTKFKEDEVDIDIFNNNYTKFCQLYRFEKVILTTELMKKQYGIDTIKMPSYIIKKMTDYNLNSKKNTHDGDYKINLIDIQNLTIYFQNNSINLTPEETQKINKYLYSLEGFHYQILGILVEILFLGLINFPMILFIILMDSTYAPYNTKNYIFLLTWEAFLYQPKVAFTELPIFIVIMICIIVILNFVDLAIYIYNMRRPIELNFHEDMNIQNSLAKFAVLLNWIVLLILLFIYISYIILCITWTLLGAIINPNYLLPYAVGAFSFITFFLTKYNNIENTIDKVKAEVSKYLKDGYNKLYNKALIKMCFSLLEQENDSLSKAKRILESSEFQKTISNLIKENILSSNHIDDIFKQVEQVQSIESMMDVHLIDKDILHDRNMINNSFLRLSQIIESSLNKKIREELSKRDAPSVLIDLVISIVNKDSEKLKESIQQILDYLSLNCIITKDLSTFLGDILYSKTERVSDNQIKILSKLIMKRLLSLAHIDDDLIIDRFITMYCTSKNLEKGEMVLLGRNINNLLTNNIRFKKVNEIYPYLVDIIKSMVDLIISFDNSDCQFIRIEAFIKYVYSITNHFVQINKFPLKTESIKDNIKINKNQIVNDLQNESDLNNEQSRLFNIDEKYSGILIDEIKNSIIAITTLFNKNPIFEFNNEDDQIKTQQLCKSIVLLLLDKNDIINHDKYNSYKSAKQKIGNILYNNINMLREEPKIDDQYLRYFFTHYDIIQIILNSGKKDILNEDWRRLLAFLYMENRDNSFKQNLSFNTKIKYLIQKDNQYFNIISKKCKMANEPLIGMIKCIKQYQCDEFVYSYIDYLRKYLNISEDNISEDTKYLLRIILLLCISFDELFCQIACMKLQIKYWEIYIMNKKFNQRMNYKNLNYKIVDDCNILFNNNQYLKQKLLDELNKALEQSKNIKDLMDSYIYILSRLNPSVSFPYSNDQIHNQKNSNLKSSEYHPKVIEIIKNLRIMIYCSSDVYNEFQKGMIGLAENLQNDELIQIFQSDTIIEQLLTIQGFSRSLGTNSYDAHKIKYLKPFCELIKFDYDMMINIIKILIASDTHLIFDAFDNICENITNAQKKFLNSVLKLSKIQLNFNDQITINHDKVHGLPDLITFTKKFWSLQQTISDPLLQSLLELMLYFDKKKGLYNLFKSLKNPLNPLCTVLSFYAVFKGWGQTKITFDCNSEKKTLSIKNLLCLQLGGNIQDQYIYPEFFDIFDSILVYSIPCFVDKVSNLIKIKKGNGSLDMGLIKSILCLLNLQAYDFGPIAAKFGCSLDLIDFIFYMKQIKFPTTRNQALEHLKLGKGTKKILQSFSVDCKEFFSILSFAYGLFDSKYTLKECLTILDPLHQWDYELYEVMLFIFNYRYSISNSYSKALKMQLIYQPKLDRLLQKLSLDNKNGSLIYELRNYNHYILEKYLPHLEWILGKVGPNNKENELQVCEISFHLLRLIQGLIAIGNCDLYIDDERDINFYNDFDNDKNDEIGKTNDNDNDNNNTNSVNQVNNQILIKSRNLSINYLLEELCIDPCWNIFSKSNIKDKQDNENNFMISSMIKTINNLLSYKMCDWISMCDWNMSMLFFYDKDINQQIKIETYINFLENANENILILSKYLCKMNVNSNYSHDKNLRLYFRLIKENFLEILNTKAFIVYFKNKLVSQTDSEYNNNNDTDTDENNDLDYILIHKMQEFFYNLEYEDDIDIAERLIQNLGNSIFMLNIIHTLIKCIIPYIYEKYSLKKKAKNLKIDELLQANNLAFLDLMILAIAKKPVDIFQRNAILVTMVERKLTFVNPEILTYMRKFDIIKLLLLTTSYVPSYDYEWQISPCLFDPIENNKIQFMNYKKARPTDLIGLRKEAKKYLTNYQQQQQKILIKYQELYKINYDNMTCDYSNVIHDGFFCSLCAENKQEPKKPIKGIRYRCLDCQNLHLCSFCYEKYNEDDQNLDFKDQNLSHNRFHTVIEITTKLDYKSSVHMLYTYFLNFDGKKINPCIGFENEIYQLIPDDIIIHLYENFDGQFRYESIKNKWLPRRKAIFKFFEEMNPQTFVNEIILSIKEKDFDYNEIIFKEAIIKSPSQINYFSSIDLERQMILNQYVESNNCGYEEVRHKDSRTHIDYDIIKELIKDFELVLISPKMKILYSIRDLNIDNCPIIPMKLLYLIHLGKRADSAQIYHILTQIYGLQSNLFYLRDVLSAITKSGKYGYGLLRSHYINAEEIIMTLGILKETQKYLELNLLKKPHKHGLNYFVPIKTYKLIERLCEPELAEVIAFFHAIYNYNLDAWLELIKLCLVNPSNINGDCPLKKIIYSLNFEKICILRKQMNIDEKTNISNLDMLKVQNLIKPKYVYMEKNYDQKNHLLCELFHMIYPCMPGYKPFKKYKIDNTLKNNEKICYMICHVLNLMLENSTDKLAETLFTNYLSNNQETYILNSNYQTLDQDTLSYTIVNNIQLMFKILQDFDYVHKLPKKQLITDFDIDKFYGGRWLAWAVFLKSYFGNVDIKERVARAILKTKSTGPNNFFYTQDTYMMPKTTVFTITNLGSPNNMEKLDELSLFKYYNIPNELFYRTVSIKNTDYVDPKNEAKFIITPTNHQKIYEQTRKILFSIGIYTQDYEMMMKYYDNQNTLYDVIQNAYRNTIKDTITWFCMNNSDIILGSENDIDSLLYTIENDLELIANVISYINSNDYIDNCEEFYRRFGNQIEKIKELTVSIKANKSNHCDCEKEVRMLNIHHLMKVAKKNILKYSLNQLKENQIFIDTDNNANDNLCNYFLRDALLFRDLFINHTNTTINLFKKDSVNQKYVHLNNYMIIAEYFYGCRLLPNLFEYDYNDINIDKKILNIINKLQNTLRNCFNYFNNGKEEINFNAIKDFATILVEIIYLNSTEQKDFFCQKQFEDLLNILSIATGYDFHSLCDLEYHFRDTECELCKNQVIPHLTSHIQERIDKKFKQEGRKIIWTITKRKNRLIDLEKILLGLEIGEENSEKCNSDYSIDFLIKLAYNLLNILNHTLETILLNDDNSIATLIESIFNLLEDGLNKIKFKNNIYDKNIKFLQMAKTLSIALIKVKKFDIKNIMDIILPVLNLDYDKSKIIMNYITQIFKLIDLPKFKNQLAIDFDSNKKSIALSEVESILKKIKQGNTTFKDIFNICDLLGDRNGTINQQEFHTFIRRIEINLGIHRLHELFVNIKGKALSPDNTDFDEKEFIDALEYIGQKELEKAINLLNMAPQTLYLMLFYLCFLLIIIFIFIFIGIRAFAIGGTFSAIINSALPAIGALGLSRKHQNNKKALSEAMISKAIEESKTIFCNKKK